ncbi:DNA excision repair protein ERCC-8, partial [Rhizophlyctis rosea]
MLSLVRSADSSIHIYDLEDLAEIGPKLVIKSIAHLDKGQGHRYSVTGVQWFPFDTGLFTTSSMDCKVKVWDANVLQPAFEFNLEQKVLTHAFSPIATSHSLIATGPEGAQVRLCDMRGGGFTHSLTGHTRSVLAVQWSPRDEFILASGSQDRTIRIWDVRKANACIMAFDQHSSRSKKRKDPSTTTTATAHDAAINGLRFTSDGLHLLSTGHDEKMRLWDVYTGKNSLINYGPYIHNRIPISRIPAITPVGECNPPLVFYPNDDGDVLVFGLWTGELVKRLKGHFGRVGCVGVRRGVQ